MSDTADCIFCRIVQGELDSDRLYEDDDVLVFALYDNLGERARHSEAPRRDAGRVRR